MVGITNIAVKGPHTYLHPNFGFPPRWRKFHVTPAFWNFFIFIPRQKPFPVVASYGTFGGHVAKSLPGLVCLFLKKLDLGDGLFLIDC